MTSRQHQAWISAGRPDSGLCLPLAQLRDVLRAAGFTVFDWPNDAHLDAEPPEDHTFYSETGWPKVSPKYWRHAIDIMPGPGGAAALTALGQRIFDDRQAGRITWLKYMNWPSTGNLSQAVQDRWEPSHSRGPSGDTGHIHISSVTGVETLSAPYNPLGPAGQPATITLPSEDLMFHAVGPGGHYLCTGFQSVQVTPGQLEDLRTLIKEGLVPPLAVLGDGTNHNTIDFPRQGWTEAFGKLIVTPTAAAPTPSAPATGDVTVTGTLHLGAAG